MVTISPRRVLVAHQPAYLPWPGFFTRLLSEDVDRLVLLDHVQFSERGWQNRNTIADRRGISTLLTVPVHRHHGQALTDTRIAGTSWAQRHWRTLQHSYGKAPHWPSWRDQLEAIYHTHWDHLADLNEALILLLAGGLDLQLPIIRSSSLNLTHTKTAMLTELCQRTNSNILRVGTGALHYLDAATLHTAGVTVEVATFKPTAALGRRAGGSLLDTLLRHGPATRDLILAGVETRDWELQVVTR